MLWNTLSIRASRIAATRRAYTLCLFFAVLSAWFTPSLVSGDDTQRDFFESRIRPVLLQHCYECHSKESKPPKGGLLVDSASALQAGGDSGPAVVAKSPDESLLLAAIRYDGLEMPPDERLPDHVVHDFEKWIEQGAFDPRVDSPPSDPALVSNDHLLSPHWAFTAPVRHRPPPTTDTTWPTTEIDAFIWEGFQQAQLTPAADADPRTLVRRVYYDLIGLPPPLDVIEAFAKAPSAAAWEAIVDRLLGSQQFGIHWGRHWLDVARYADSNGGDFNATFHDAWRYRNYVIDSWNRDKPFDQFVREQIAGDLLPARSDEERAEQLVGSGFLMLGTKMLSERDKEKLTMDVVDEQVSAIGQAFMGLTLGCARCHDHKFDPIPTEDYYALAGIFVSTTSLQGESQQYVSTWPRHALPTSDEHRQQVETHTTREQELSSQLKDVAKQIKTIEQQLAAWDTAKDAILVD
ncbi:MAG: DUF1549 domain-containing protein, partial [Planctomycetales bacterium]|nr:DUF1549 domain-containing protein [Planctomycetales bacterium]